MAWVYILQLSNNNHYIGSTNNLDQRLFDHQRGKSPYTKKYLPVTLVFQKEFRDFKIARKAEHYLKSLKSRKIIEEIIKTNNFIFLL